ncbi:calcium-binding protein, partial [Azospirillum sp.]|uniref:calcium-binding protein n=1 Tax=Azospirillum sp. TaxID=34012 RepID=UPI003D71C362
AKLYFVRDGDHLHLRFQGSTDDVTIVNRFSNYGYPYVQTAAFADGSTVDLAALSVTVEITGTAASETVYGAAYTEVLYGKAGHDVLYGYDNNDTLIGGAGADTMYGGTGNDLIDGSADGADTWADRGYGEAGNDTLIGGAGADLFDGGDDHDSLTGGGGNDTLTGGIGNDTLSGGIGNDSLTGGAGRDVYVFNPGDGVDTVVGDGEDTVLLAGGFTQGDLYFARFGANLHLRFRDRTDELILLGRFAPSGTGDGTNYVPTVTFTDGTTINLTRQDLALTTVGTGALYGYNADDLLQAGNSATSLYGYGGNDGLLGGNGNDYLYGGTGHDWMEGGAGGDVLDGGAGEDTLAGGTGADLFKCWLTVDSGDWDTITDFNAAQGDRIDISAIDVSSAPGNQPFTFIGEAEFAGVAGQLRLSVASSVTWVLADLDGDGFQDMGLSLYGSQYLTASNFVL